MPTLGERLRELRISKQLSYADVERLADIPHQTISAIEYDKWKAPDPIKLSKLARVYEVPERELFELAGYATPGPKTQVGVAKPTNFCGKIGYDKKIYFVEFNPLNSWLHWSPL